jgi:predicted DNA-binding transcriptional regulator AlpA
MPPIVVSERRAAELLGISQSTLIRLRRKKRDETDPVAPRWRRLSERRIGYRVVDLEAWAESRQV